MHDIGKLNLPLDLLEKAGPLSEEEYETMKTHSELGYERLKENINISSKTKMGVYMHHENVNGSGYPLGLRGDQIYMFAKKSFTLRMFMIRLQVSVRIKKRSRQKKPSNF